MKRIILFLIIMSFCRIGFCGFDITSPPSTGTGFTNGTDITVGNLTVNTEISINSTTSAQKLDLGVGAIRFNQLSAPGVLVLTATATAGNLNGTYYYRVTFVNGIGETSLGTVTAGTLCENTTMSLTSIPVSTDPSVTSRKIYRSRTSSSNMYPLATISNNVNTTYEDNIADASLEVTRSNDRENSATGAIYINTTESAILGSSNTAFGRTALDSITVGINNVGLGVGAGTNITNGSYNTAIGYGAYDGGSTRTDNTVIGYSALGSSAHSGSRNTAVGSEAMLVSTSGSNNVVVGYDALSDAITADGNTIIGSHAALYNGNGSYNTIIGHYAGEGVDNVANYSRNMFIGYNVAETITTGGDNIIIGYDIDPPLNTTNYYLSIGDTIYGNLSTKTVGIGVTAPTQRLEVAGNTTISGWINYGNDSQTSDSYIITNGITSLVIGMPIMFRANTSNTGACELNVSGLGAKPLKSLNDQDPQDNYIEAGSMVWCSYDGTNFQILSADANP